MRGPGGAAALGLCPSVPGQGRGGGPPPTRRRPPGPRIPPIPQLIPPRGVAGRVLPWCQRTKTLIFLVFEHIVNSPKAYAWEIFLC